MLLFALVLAVAAPASGGSADEVARARFEEGRVAYDLGRFDEAIADFEAAYAARPLPGFLFNLGQCHFQKGDGARAVWFYERYLDAGALDDDERAFVEELIAEARALPPQPSSASPASVDGRARTAQVSHASPSSRRSRSRAVDEDEADAGPPWLWIGLGTGAAVAAAAVVGAVVVASSPGPDQEPSLGVLDRSGP